jgi:hypothetical protein
MAITLAQSANVKVQASGVGTTLSSDPLTVSAGSLIVAAINLANGGATVTGVSDNVNGSYTLDKSEHGNTDTGYWSQIYSFPNSASGTITVTLTVSDTNACSLTVYELAGAATSSPVGVTVSHAPSGSSPSASLITTAYDDCIIATCNVYNDTWSATAGTSFTLTHSTTSSSVRFADEYWLDVGTAGSKTAAFNISDGVGGPYCTMAAVAYKKAAAGGGCGVTKPMWPMSYF